MISRSHATSPQVLRAHVLPLTNCAFNKSGDRFITGSYDRTCKVRWTLHAAGKSRLVTQGESPHIQSPAWPRSTCQLLCVCVCR